MTIECGYLVQANTTPAAEKYLKEGQLFFCDSRLQDLIVQEMLGQEITDKNIACCSNPQNCPLRIPSIESLLKR